MIETMREIPADTYLSFDRQVRGAAGYVAALRRADRRGPLATLRRLRDSGDRVPPQVFWDVVERYQIRERDEEFWLAVLPLMVEHPHEAGLPAGRALARADLSAARLERWLRMDVDAARREVARLLSRLKGAGFDWIGFAYLLRHWNDEHRRGFARDFFLSPEYRQRATAGESS